MEFNRSQVFCVTGGVFCSAVGCAISYYFIYQSIWEIRGLVKSPYPVSAFSSPTALLGVSVLLSAVVGGWIITFGRDALKAVKGKSDKSKTIFVTGISLISMSILLIGIYFLCVQGYRWYVSYSIVKAIATSEKQFLIVRDIIIRFARIDCLRGILYFVLGGLIWWLARTAKITLLPDSSQ